MKTTFVAALGALCLATGAHAAGDAAAGEKEFKKCTSCHMVAADDGTVVVKGGKVGPNLFGVVGRQVASTDFNYGDTILAVGASGVVWDEAELAAYMTDPKAWLADKSGDAAAKTKMTFKLKKAQEDVAAYLATFGAVTQ